MYSFREDGGGISRRTGIVKEIVYHLYHRQDLFLWFDDETKKTWVVNIKGERVNKDVFIKAALEKFKERQPLYEAINTFICDEVCFEHPIEKNIKISSRN